MPSTKSSFLVSSFRLTLGMMTMAVLTYVMLREQPGSPSCCACPTRLLPSRPVTSGRFRNRSRTSEVPGSRGERVQRAAPTREAAVFRFLTTKDPPVPSERERESGRLRGRAKREAFGRFQLSLVARDVSGVGEVRHFKCCPVAVRIHTQPPERDTGPNPDTNCECSPPAAIKRAN